MEQLQILETEDPYGVRLIGEIDMATAPALSEALLAAVAGANAITVDMSDVTFMDSSGLQAILAAAAEATAEEPLVVKDPSPAVLRVMELVGVEQMPQIRIVEESSRD
jgi:stage II sporulation protein AA (anti-sigma F factor antagonist)